MDTMTSSEFRKRYVGLTRPTVVTVNGHYLGVWNPITLHSAAIAKAFDVPVELAHAMEPDYAKARAEAQGERDAFVKKLAERYDERPIRPVPKHSGR